jgi:heptosyltransferase-1
MRERKETAAPFLFGAAPRYLIVRLSALGDTLMSTPVAQALREAFPEAFLGWVVHRRCAPIVDGNPYLDRVHVWDGSVRGFFRVVREIRQESYEVALDVQGLLKSALIPWLARIPVRVGFADAREGAARLLTHPLSDRHRTTALHRLTTLNLTPKNFVVLAPATTRPQKHWVAERWAKLAERLWHQLRLPSLLLAGKSDRPLLARIARQSAVPLPLVDDLSLKESVALIEQAALLVGPDSFPIHAALAVGTPVIALFGPNDPFRFRAEKGVCVLEHALPCRPCGRHPICGGLFTCMRLIGVDEVVAAAEQLLAPLPVGGERSS